MPLLEHEATRGGRLRVFVRAQLPFAIAFCIVAVLVAIVLPERFSTPWVLSGTALAVVSTLLAITLPWERWPIHAMAVVAVLDLLAVACIRLELIGVAPGASLLCIFPVLWLAFGFTPRMIIVAVAGTLVISSAPYLLRSRAPESALEWLNVVLLPLLTIGIAVAVNIGARQLRRNQRAVRDQAAELEQSLARALDAEALAESILETVDAGVAFYTADGALRLANTHAADMVAAVGFRLDTPPYAGEHVLQADRRTPIPFSEQIIPRALRGELLSNHLEWLGEPGSQRAILASSSRVVREGTLLGTVVVAHDVTDLADAISVREAFLTTVSHELRTPLTSIHGYLELAMDDAEIDAPGLLPALRVVQRNAVELERRVRELLAASDSVVQIEPSRVDLAEIAARAIESATADGPGANVRLHAERTAVVSADAEQVQRAIAELIANAVKFTPRDGSIDVVVEPGSAQVDVTVTDTGVGMDHDELRQAFDKFYRTEHARDQAIQGVGLGLPTVQAIARAHGGSVTLRSAPAEPDVQGGTVATLVLPVEPIPSPAR